MTSPEFASDQALMGALTGVPLSEERAGVKGFPEPIPFLRIAAEAPADLSRQPH